MTGTGGTNCQPCGCSPVTASLPGRAPRLTTRLPSQRPRLHVLVLHFLQLSASCASSGVLRGTGVSHPHLPFLYAPSRCLFFHQQVFSSPLSYTVYQPFG